MPISARPQRLRHLCQLLVGLDVRRCRAASVAPGDNAAAEPGYQADHDVPD